MKPLLFIANLLSSLLKFVIYLTAYGAAVIGFAAVQSLYGTTAALVALPAILVALPFLILAETFVFRILIPKPRVGVHQVGGGSHFVYQLNHRLFDLAIVPLFPPFQALYKNSEIFRILTLKTLGAQAKFSARIGHTTKIHDACLLTLGSNSSVADDVQIHSYAVEMGKFILRRVFIGPKASVGAASLIFPGTEISEGSVLGMGSSTRNEMKIPQYELWVGNPASHLSKLIRPLLYTSSQSREHHEGRGDQRGSGRRPSSSSQDRDRDNRGRYQRVDRNDRNRSRSGSGYGDNRRGGQKRPYRRRPGSEMPNQDSAAPRRESTAPQRESVAPKRESEAPKSAPAAPKPAPRVEPTKAPEAPQPGQQKPAAPVTPAPAPKPVESPKPTTSESPYIGPIKK